MSLKSSCLLFVCIILSSANVFAQSDVYSVKAPADEFLMVVSRDGIYVRVLVDFTAAPEFDHLIVERKSDFNPEFVQCKYFERSQLKAGEKDVVLKDMYPNPGSSSVLYRIKLIKSGVVYTYPPVKLPALR